MGDDWAVENGSYSTSSCSLLGKAISEHGIRGCNLPGEVVDPTHPASDVIGMGDMELGFLRGLGVNSCIMTHWGEGWLWPIVNCRKCTYLGRL